VRIAVLNPGGGADQVTGQALSSGAIGGGVSGLVALAALVLLFLFRRKKKEVVELAEDTVETVSTTVDADDGYISEYGLSDADQPFDDGEDDEDLPQLVEEDGGYEGSEMDAVSERNPDQFSDAEPDPDET
jgi:LPXTG-motif cell wall-anchored protein